jgi:hypothetical protein
MGNYLLKVLIAFDVFVGTVLGFSQGDITISAACGLALKHQTGVFEQLIGTALNAVFKNHCATAIDDDIARAQTAVKRLQS